jgi:hypothetical protein
MDPISAIGLAAALAQLLVVLTQTIQYLNDVQNAPKGRGRTIQEAAALLGLLISLNYKVESASPQDP